MWRVLECVLQLASFVCVVIVKGALDVFGVVGIAFDEPL